MKPFKDVRKAAKYLENYEGKASDLKLPICNGLQDPVGINMAIITEIALVKGREPNGYDEQEDYRVYTYKEME
jgi:hypothetical protein